MNLHSLVNTYPQKSCEKLPEALAGLTGKDLPLYEANPEKLGKVTVFSNARTPTQSVKENEATGKCSPNRGTKKKNLQKLTLKLWRYELSDREFLKLP